jgi:hypothetical protein
MAGNLLRESLKTIFGINEDADAKLDDILDDPSLGQDKAGEDPAAADPAKPADPAADPADAPDAAPTSPDAEAALNEPDAGGEEQVPGTGDTIMVGSDAGGSDESKIQEMFTDVGTPETDYGLTNPNNIRLAKFRFNNAGIDPGQLMSDAERKAGLPVDKLIFRLTPEQYESYLTKGKDLRAEYDLLNKREKNIVLFNSRIPIYHLDKNTNEMQKIDDSDPNLLKNAFSKIDSFVTQRFGENWVDNMDALDFVQSIKVNFAERESITPNMLTLKFFDKSDNDMIPFNKLYVKTPKSVDEFIKENKDNQDYLRSSVYRAMAAGYLESSTDRNGVFATIKVEEEPEADAAGGEAAPDAAPSDEALDTGAEMPPGGEAAPEAGAEGGADAGADAGAAPEADAGGDAGGEDLESKLDAALGSP